VRLCIERREEPEASVHELFNGGFRRGAINVNECFAFNDLTRTTRGSAGLRLH